MMEEVEHIVVHTLDGVENLKVMVKEEIIKVEKVIKDMEYVKEVILGKKRNAENLKRCIEAVRMKNKMGNRITRVAIVNPSGVRRLVLVEEECEKVKKKKFEEKYRKVVELVDQLMGEIEKILEPLVEQVEEMEGEVRKVHKPPSLVELAARRVVEEGLEVEGLPTTLQARVVGLPAELMYKTASEVAELICARVQGIKMGTRMTEFFGTLTSPGIKTVGQIAKILESNIG